MTPAPVVAILEGANQPRSETMRAVLFHFKGHVLSDLLARQE